jgi:hypothetical protein
MLFQQTLFAILALASLTVLSLTHLDATLSGIPPASQDHTKSDDKATGLGPATLQVLNPTGGVDLSDYLRKVYLEINQGWFSVMPAEVQLGKKGVVIVRFSISKDGNLNKDSPPTVEISSGVISRWTRRQCLEFARAHPLARYRKLSRDRISISA